VYDAGNARIEVISPRLQKGDIVMVNWMKCVSPVLLLALSLLARETALADGPTQSIKIDVPVKLEKADIVFNMNHFVMRGDMPVGLRYLDLMEKSFKGSGTTGKIIGVFYGEAAHFTLTDKAYNAARNVNTGNPHKALIADLIGRGVVIEECAVSMKAQQWNNEDLLPGVLVNSGAIQRLIQLEQQGFVQIQP
jgi:intracellular sulfur oxidation DsrE/DsrF family protein